jgi:ABC-type sugar transport system permease subunit
VTLAVSSLGGSWAKGRPWRAERLQPYGFFLPAFVLVTVVSFAPLGFALVQGLFRSDYLNLGRFVGLANYADFLWSRGGSAFLGQSLIYVGGTVALALPLGFGLALALNDELPLRGVLRTILVLPWLVSNLVAALLWGWLGNPRYSPVVDGLRHLGLPVPDMVTDPHAAMAAVILCNAWASYPLVMVFVLAALQTIPQELIEAAEIDGATPWQRFRHITLPMVSGTTLVALVLTTLHAFKNVEIVLLMTGGGPAGATETMALRIFQEGMQFFRMGVASAGAVIVFATNLLFTLAFVRVLRGEEGA